MVRRALINTQTTSAPTQDSHVWCVCWWVRSVKVPSSFIGETAGANVPTIDRLIGVRNKWAKAFDTLKDFKNPDVYFRFYKANRQFDVYSFHWKTFSLLYFVRRSGTRWCWFVIRQFKLSGLKRPRRRVINFLMFSIVSDLIWAFFSNESSPLFNICLNKRVNVCDWFHVTKGILLN